MVRLWPDVSTYVQPWVTSVPLALVETAVVFAGPDATQSASRCIGRGSPL